MVKFISLSSFVLLSVVGVNLLPLPTSDPARLRDVDCEVCKFIVFLVHDAVESNKTFEEVYPAALMACTLLLESKNLVGEYMCPGLISAYGPVVQYVATEIILEPEAVCTELKFCPRKSTKNSKVSTGFHYEESMKHFSSSAGASEALFYKNVRNYSRKTSSNSNSSTERARNLVNFVQLADVHLDSQYSEGSPTNCDLYFCCRSYYNGTGSAGHYGSHGCDIPKVTLDLVLDKVLTLKPAPKFIVYTGDNSPHDVWSESDSSQMKASQVVVDYLTEKLASLNVPIYPALGNHESWPESEYLGTLKEYQGLTQFYSTLWEQLVDLPPSAKESVAEGGYYSMPVQDGLRIISFNSDYGYTYNFYALLNFKNDHYKRQWEWLVKELEAAENNQEKVILIGHIPPGDEDNNADYGERYLNVTKRFRDTIAFHLFGHTHMDQFQLIQDEEGLYGVVLVSPSITTYPHNNPAFRVYTMDQDTMELLNYTQYYLNLTEADDLHKAGRDDEVEFKISYTSKAEYELDDLSATSWQQLFNRFSSDSSLLTKYNYNKRAKGDQAAKVCDSSCQRDNLCDISNIISINALTCRL